MDIQADFNVVSSDGQTQVSIGPNRVGDVVDAAAERWGDRHGWRFEDTDVSFREMRDRANAVAKSLLAMGIGKGDVVATLMPNRPEFAYLEFGCAKVGAILCPINTRSKTFELEHCLNHGQVRLLVLVETFLKIDYLPMLEGLAPRSEWQGDGRIHSATVPSLQRIVSISPEPSADLLAWSGFLELGRRVSDERVRAVQAEQEWQNPLILQYTSGTTSKPKGALCNHQYVLYFAVEYLLRMGLREGEAFLNTQPFYHNGGSCGAVPVPLSIGCKAVSADYYDVEKILGLIEAEKCTVRTGYGAMYVMEMNHPNFRNYDVSSIRSGWCVGTPALMQRVQDEMNIPGLVQVYGATEGSGTSGYADEPWEVRSTTCGRALTGMELGIFDPESNRRLGPGEVGEIRLRGWLKMSGYHRQPDMTAKTIDADGWVHMGDLGTVDEKGYLTFAGRLKDMLKIGGENVSAEEVETILLEHPAIVQAAVIGAPDDRLAEVVMAVVELKADATLTEAELIDYCRPRMANFRVPRHVRYVRDWPMTESGKIQKAKLRETLLLTLKEPA